MARIGAAVRTLALCSLALSTIAFAKTKQTSDKNSTIVTYPFAFSVSRPVTEFPLEQPLAEGQNIHEPGPGPLRYKQQTGPVDQVDPVLQTRVLPEVGASQGVSFEGIISPGYVPSDSNLAVGPDYIVETVNVQFAVYNKSGTLLAGPTNIQNLFSGLGGNCAGTVGDPIVLYDRQADRWVITDIGYSSGYAECVAVSQTNNPTGSYYAYGYSFGSNLNDYDKLSTWATNSNSAYLATYNIFEDAENFTGAELCGFDRTKMLAGNSTAAQLCETTPSTEFSYLPSDMDGPTPPVDGTPGLFITWQNNNPGELYLRKLTLDFASGTASLGSPTTIDVANDAMACGNGGQCVPQEGTTQTLDTLGDRMMYRFAIRHFADHDRAVFNHAVGSSGLVAIRWYELYDPAGTVTLNQQGTFAPDTTYRWMASMAEDQDMDIGMGYSASSSSIYPGIRFTGRTPSDPLGTMESESTILTGTGAQVGSYAYRWGDYTAMQVDPSDDCTFWYVDQYQQVTGTFDWYTNISSFKFNGCTAGPTFDLSASPTTVSVVQGGQVNSTITVTPLNGFTGNVTLSASGLPSGVTASFNPNPAATSSTVTFSASASAATGTTDVTINGVSGSVSNLTTVQITVTSSGPVVGLSPTSLTWGKVVVGNTPSPKKVVMTNTGGAALAVGSITASGDFAIVSGKKTDCGATLAVGKTCNIRVSFTPQQTGPLTGSVSINDNAPGSPQSISLSGTGKE